MAKKTSETRKRRRKGVPMSVTALCMVAALLFGGVAGYLTGRMSSGASDLRRQLTEAKTSIAELQSALYLITEDSQYEEGAAAFSAAGNDNNELLAMPDDSGAADWGGPDAAATPEPVAVVEYDGGSIMSDAVLEQYDLLVSSYLQQGYERSEIPAEALTEIMHSLAAEAILLQKAEELDCYTISSQDEADIALLAQEEYDEMVNTHLDTVNEEGLSSEALLQKAQAELLAEEGVSLESITAEIRESWWEEKLYAMMTAGVAVSEEELRAQYDEQVAAQKALYEEFPDEYEFDMAVSDQVLYHLEGYRAVKQIFLPLEEDDAARCDEILAEMASGGDQTALTKELDALYAPLEAVAQQALSALDAGADFDQLIAEYGQDVGMTEEPTASRGYYVSANSTSWEQAFLDAAMAIDHVGGTSPIVRTSEGVHILQWFGEATPGAVPYEQVRDELEQTMLEELRADAYDQQLADWLEEANVRFYPERIQ